MMIYQDLQPLNRQAAEGAFATKDVKRICETLVSIAFYEPDWKWAQNKCLEFLGSNNSEIKGVAAICLGHIARIHRQLEKEKVIVALRSHINDNDISGQVGDALDDINMFLQ